MISVSSAGRSRSPDSHGEPVLAGSSPVMQDVRETLRKAATVDFRVRIEGPSGTGKAVAARLVHRWSHRSDRPFVRQSLATIPDGLELARLCGWVKGAFTGAVGDVTGMLEAANGGTLFLDEIACGSVTVQQALLQLLEDGEVLRLGEGRYRRLDVRFVFATNADLESEVREGRFRHDLLARMGAVVIRMPGLAQHLDDLPELVESLLPSLAAQGRCPVRPVGPTELDALSAHTWPGNVRELENVLAYYLTFGELPLLESMSEAEVLRQTLMRHGWNRSQTGRTLGISRKTVNARIRRFGLVADEAAGM